jgi:hypothetical protein
MKINQFAMLFWFWMSLVTYLGSDSWKAALWVLALLMLGSVLMSFYELTKE